jgi:hypothetical protein
MAIKDAKPTGEVMGRTSMKMDETAIHGPLKGVSLNTV